MKAPAVSEKVGVTCLELRADIGEDRAIRR
jgi:hypothetical protein